MANSRFTFRAVVVLFAVFGLLATACGGSSGPEDTAADDVATATDDSGSDDSGDESGDGASGDSDSESSDSDSSDSAGESSSPLDEFLGLPSFDPSNAEASEAQFAEEERKREEAVAACMRAEGFEYTPVDNSSFAIFGGEDGVEWGSKEWVEKFGYGVTTQSFSQSEVGVDLIGYDDSQFGGGDDFDPEDDPNYVYMNSLSEAEQKAYQEALYGDEPEIDFDAMTDEEIDEIYSNFEFSGCQNTAQQDGAFGSQQAFYQEFGDQLDEMYEAMEDDPRVVEYEAEIETCVTEKGVEYVSQNDAWEVWEEQLTPIRERTYAQYENDPLDDIDSSQMSDEEIQDFYENLPRPELSAEDKVTLGELQQKEIAIAVAAFECGDNFERQNELFSDLRIEYEQRFLDENRAALEAFAASN